MGMVGGIREVFAWGDDKHSTIPTPSTSWSIIVSRLSQHVTKSCSSLWLHIVADATYGFRLNTSQKHTIEVKVLLLFSKGGCLVKRLTLKPGVVTPIFSNKTRASNNRPWHV
jgi:hypothetical protein